MKGTVKFFNRKKGFGFINGEDGQDYFVHVSALQQGTFLRDNDQVSFDPAPGERGLKAEHVQLLVKGSEAGTKKATDQAEETEEDYQQ